MMNDLRLETIIGRLLQTGVLLAAVVVAAGGILYIVRHHAEPANYQHFVEGGASIQTLSGIIQSASHLDSEGLIQIGLVLLILTPVARVAMAVVGFLMERDRMYAVVSLVVLLVLAFSLIHAT
jgi:uncharacterized membrane protein